MAMETSLLGIWLGSEWIGSQKGGSSVSRPFFLTKLLHRIGQVISSRDLLNMAWSQYALHSMPKTKLLSISIALSNSTL